MQGKEFAQRTSRREGSQEIFMFILGKKKKKKQLSNWEIFVFVKFYK